MTKATNALRTIALVRTFRLTPRIRYVEQNVMHPSGTEHIALLEQVTYEFET